LIVRKVSGICVGQPAFHNCKGCPHQRVHRP
jgi:hypothetical protein